MSFEGSEDHEDEALIQGFSDMASTMDADYAEMEEELAAIEAQMESFKSELLATQMKLDFELEEKLRRELEADKLCEELKEMINFERLEKLKIQKDREFMLEEKRKVETKCEALEEEIEFLLKEKLKAQKGCKELEEKHQCVLQEKREVEMKCAMLEKDLESVGNENKELKENFGYQLNKCKLDAEDLKERCERLLEEEKNRKVDDSESQDMKHKELASRLLSKKDPPRPKALNGSATARSRALRSSGMHGEPISLSDNDDDCAPREKNPKVLKRKQASSKETTYDNGGDSFEQNSTQTGEMKQVPKLIPCGSMASRVLETVVSSNKKVKKPQKLSIESHAMTSNEHNDDDSDGIKNGRLYAVSAIVTRSKALKGKKIV